MKTAHLQNLFAGALVGVLALSNANAQVPTSITTPDRMDTRLGTLEFKDGAPSKATVEKVYDNLDFMHGVEAFVNAYQGSSTYAIRQGLRDMGVEDNSLLVFSELMD